MLQKAIKDGMQNINLAIHVENENGIRSNPPGNNPKQGLNVTMHEDKFKMSSGMLLISGLMSMSRMNVDPLIQGLFLL